MAITLADFQKIWASTSPLTPYSFSEANYKQGWNFIGSTPPARQMWDFLQKNNDEKMQYLLNNFDNYLPLSGGTLTGGLTNNGSTSIPINIKTTGTDYRDIQIESSDGNHRIAAIRASKTSEGRCEITIGASTTSNEAPTGITISRSTTDIYATAPTPDATDNSKKIATTEFVNAKAGNYLPLAGGNITGSLTVSGKDVERVNASGSNYIRYESGIQICWGSSADFNATGEKTVTFPAAFTGISYRLAVSRDWVMNWNENYYVKEKTNTSFKIVVTGTASTNNHFYSYVAVGYWK